MSGGGPKPAVVIPSGFEDLSMKSVLERHSGKAIDSSANHDVAEIRVAEATSGARRARERRHDGPGALFGRVGGVLPSGHHLCTVEIGVHAGATNEDLVNCGVRPAGVHGAGQIREELGDRNTPRRITTLDQPRIQGSRHRLRTRPDMPLVVDINSIDRVTVPLAQNLDFEIAGVRHNRRPHGGNSVPIAEALEQGPQAIAFGHSRHLPGRGRCWRSDMLIGVRHGQSFRREPEFEHGGRAPTCPLG